MASQHELSTKQIDELCDRFEAAWRSGDPPRLEEILADLCERDREHLLRELLFIDHAYRCRRGDPPDEAEYRERFPDETNLINEVLAAGAGHRSNSQFATGHGNHSGTAHTIDRRSLPATDAKIQDTLLEAVLAGDGDATSGPTLGDYELLEEVGRGGMGIVFRARQKSVSRIVAVKLLRRDKLKELSPDSRDTMIERFRTEAQSAAQLQHDHIVPVYEVGEENGLYYYSMRFVSGESLGDLIKDHPLDNRTAAELIEPIARALDEAHKNGVLHRDIKPRNVIVEKKTGRPLLTDFGLAKLLESNQEMTRTGDVMGSPPYMSPEQATDAASVTRSADIYSLGATLYHILTGRAPFQAANVAETLRQVLFDEPIPLRQLNPAIDRDLETITLKCLEKEPARRFSTAGDLAEELQRFLQNKPIKSRAISTTGRFVRVCRRNPVVSLLGFGIAALLVALPVVLAIGYYRAEASRLAAEKNLRIAEGRLDLAADAVDDFTSIATREDSLKAHGLDDLRREFLEASRQYYDRIVQQEGGGEKLQAERGKAYGRLADIEADLGQQQEAARLYGQAVTVFQTLQEKHPTNRDYGRLQATYQTSLAASQRDLGEREAAQATLAAAHDAVHLLADRDPEATENLILLAQIHSEQAVLAMDRGQREAAETARLEAVRIWKAITKKRPDDEHLQMFAQSQHDLAIHFQQAGRNEHAVERFAAAQAIWEDLFSKELREHNREAPAYLAGKAMCQANLGLLHLRQGDVERAGDLIGSGLKQRRNLVDSHPLVPRYREELAQSHDAAGQLYQLQGKFKEAADEFRQGLMLREALRNQFSTLPQYDVSFAASQNSLGMLYKDHGRYAEAAEYFRTALEILERVAATHDDVIAYQRHIAATHYNLAYVLHRGKQHDEALAMAKVAVERHRVLVSGEGSSSADQAALADGLAELALIYDEARQPEAAASVYAELLPLRRKLAAGNGVALPLQLSAAADALRFSNLLMSQGKFDEAAQQLSDSIRNLDACVSEEPDAPQLDESLQITLEARAQVYDALAQHERAIADWDELLTICDPSEQPRFTLRRAVSLARSGEHAQAAEIAQQALAQMPPPNPEISFHALCVLSRAMAAAAADEALADDDRRARSAAYRDAALAELRRLMGDADASAEITPALLQGDADLAPLLEDDAVQKLLEQWPAAEPPEGDDEADTPAITPAN